MTILVTGMFAGSYPAFLLSAFQPVKVLKGILPTNLKGLHFRKILVVIQFALSVFLMISSLVISSQLKYIQTRKLGFEKEHLIYATISFEYETKYDALKSELLKWPGITHITRMRNFPTSDHINSSSDLNWQGKNPKDKYLFCFHDVDYDMFETFGMTMAEGRSFSRLFPTDTTAYVLNGKAVDIMGIENPVGKMFSRGDRIGKIIGVVKNFHFKSLKNEIEPLVFRLPTNHARRIFIKISSNDILRTMKYIESTWKMFVPDYQAEFGFLDDAYNKLYRSEKRLGKLVGYFTFLAIFISCLGLFGLASFTIERRTKEIGIRKVLSASVPGVVQLLSKKFIILVVISNLIAWPLAYYGAKKWLQNFAYHIDLSWLYFVISGLLVLFITIIVVSFHSLKVAVTNPVESLRYE